MRLLVTYLDWIAPETVEGYSCISTAMEEVSTTVSNRLEEVSSWGLLVSKLGDNASKLSQGPSNR
jgi:hypothetical protein